jgi:hypothetical protein
MRLLYSLVAATLMTVLLPVLNASEEVLRASWLLP